MPRKNDNFGTWSETESQMLVCKRYILKLEFLRKVCRPEKRDDFVPKILFRQRGSVLHPHRPATCCILNAQIMTQTCRVSFAKKTPGQKSRSKKEWNRFSYRFIILTIQCYYVYICCSIHLLSRAFSVLVDRSIGRAISRFFIASDYGSSSQKK